MPEHKENAYYGPESARNRESRESRETREAEMSPELIAAAQKERAEFLVKEVKTGKKQMQNILVHMGQVQQAIAQIRKQLALAATDDGNSLAADQAQVEKLRKKIAEHREELLNMREDLIRIYVKELEAAGQTGSKEQLTEKATAYVDSLIQVTNEDA